MHFSEFAINEQVLENIAKKGWETPTYIQSLVIAPAQEGSDILGGAPTGTGKSGAFLIPTISNLLEDSINVGKMRLLILEPTRELSLQVCEVAKALCEGTSLQVGAIIGGASREVQKEALWDIVVATPGRLDEMLRKDWLDPNFLETLVIDEADRMLDLGFFDEVLKICAKVRNRKQTMLFSATLEGKGVQDFAHEVLNDPYEVRVGVGGESEDKLPELLKARAYYADSADKKASILVHLLTTAKQKAIIFVRTKDRVSLVCAKLKRAGFSFTSLQGDMGQNERNASLEKFKNGDCDLLVATDVAARGLDLPDVNYVYNFDLPRQVITFVHRAGRTARAGAKGVVVSLVERPEISLMQKIERYTEREMEKRQIKGLCAAFPKALEEKTLTTERKGRASIGGRGGFDRKNLGEEPKKRVKKRYRVTKNKGKPDFAAKRAKRALIKKRHEQQNIQGES